MNEVSTNQAYRFAGFTLDPARAALLRDGEEIPLRQRTFEVLTHLVRNSGRLVPKQELFEAVWRDVAVTDDSLVQCLVEAERHSLIARRPRRVRPRLDDLTRPVGDASPSARAVAGGVTINMGIW